MLVTNIISAPSHCDSSHLLRKDVRVLGGGEDGHLHLPLLRQVDEQHQGGGGETQSENLLSASSRLRSSSHLRMDVGLVRMGSISGWGEVWTPYYGAPLGSPDSPKRINFGKSFGP